MSVASEFCYQAGMRLSHTLAFHMPKSVQGKISNNIISYKTKSNTLRSSFQEDQMVLAAKHQLSKLPYGKPCVMREEIIVFVILQLHMIFCICLFVAAN